MSNGKYRRHKWSDHFKHENSFWQKCNKCGLWRIFLMGTAHYCSDGVIGNTTTNRIDCVVGLKSR